MKLAVALLLVAACGSSKPATTPPTQPAATTTSTATTPGTAASTTAAKMPNAGKSQYSCFSYVTGNSKTPRHACMRSDDCGPYLEQAKSVGGIRELSGCANVATVYCFHEVATKDEPEGLDVCQPTLDECKAARTDVIKAKMSVDGDCGQR
jgi:hypothetical protein